MNSDKLAELLGLYGRAEEAAAHDDLATAGACITAAGELAATVPVLAVHAHDREVIGALLRSCADANAACETAMRAARERLLQRAASELHAGAGVRGYAAPGASDARFIDRRG